MAERMMALESQVSELSARLDAASSSGNPSIPADPIQNMAMHASHDTSVISMSDLGGHSGNLARFAVRQVSTIDAVARGLVAEADARNLFRVFFEGWVIV